MATVLCIDDDAYSNDLLRYALAREGLTVLSALSAGEGLRMLHAARPRPDLIVVDANLPGANGLAVVTVLRAASTAPVIVLTPHPGDKDILAAFARGADDCVAKPFTMRVFVARLVALLDRAAALPAPNVTSAHTYRLHDVTFDATGNRLVTPAQCVHLTPTESRILRLLVRYQGQVLPTARIAREVWGYDSAEASNVVKTHIRHLRVKMEQLPALPYSVQTVPGSGYLLRRADAHAYEATA